MDDAQEQAQRVSDARKLKAIEEENRKLQKLLRSRCWTCRRCEMIGKNF
jgi:hypothetical protein